MAAVTSHWTGLLDYWITGLKFYVFIGASLSEPHHMGSTVKSVFLLACLLACVLACLLACNIKIPVYG